MVLAVQTTERGRVAVRIEKGKTVVFRTRKMFADRMLAFLEKIIDGSPIEALAVVAGPGAFSATRNGVAAMNALAFALNAPIAAISKEEFVSAAPLRLKPSDSVAVIYGAEPNITTRK